MLWCLLKSGNNSTWKDASKMNIPQVSGSKVPISQDSSKMYITQLSTSQDSSQMYITQVASSQDSTNYIAQLHLEDKNQRTWYSKYKTKKRKAWFLREWEQSADDVSARVWLDSSVSRAELQMASWPALGIGVKVISVSYSSRSCSVWKLPLPP